uniref:Uncharacterized protein n=1 Tax=Panagrolaimus superbus TaxID=310955 RepID=A0A914YG76_9BILA
MNSIFPLIFGRLGGGLSPFNARISISHPFEPVQAIKLSTFKCKKVKVTLKIDANAFYDFKVEPFDGKEADGTDLCEQFDKLNILKAVEKAPFSPRKVKIIFSRHECRLVFTCDNGCTHDIPDVDGLEKTPIYISFIEETPVFGKVAKIAFRRKPEFVVYVPLQVLMPKIQNGDLKFPKKMNL